MQAYKFLEKLKLLKKDDLLKLDGIGEVLANNIEQYTSSTQFETLKTKLQSVNLEITSSQIGLTADQKSQITLINETICITGSFEISRDKIQAILESRGAKCVSTITSATTILIAGQKAGSKVEKATKKGIKIITDYQELI